MPSNEQEKNNTDRVPEKENLVTKEKAWEEVMKRVDEIDGGMEKGWKEDIDTLLVFAGLFSAVVTAFTIESYQWLSEDPSDQSIAILAQISAQLNDRNATRFEPTPFTPSPSLVRINAFWFLSLILALVDALFGLMCKQWLREYRRPTKTRTPEQWLSLRCFRDECFERWCVPSFLAALPIILEMALFCFFAGLLELLWTKHRVPFAIAVIVVGCALAFYIATTLLPGIDIVRIASRVYPQAYLGGLSDQTMSDLPQMDYLCPYKSPQAWFMFKHLAWILGPSSPFSRLIISWYRTKGIGDGGVEIFAGSTRNKLQHLSDWFSIDLDIIERYSRIADCPDMYGLKAHRWLTHEFRDSPLILPHLRTLLQALPPRLVMPTVFDSDIVRLDREWTMIDVEHALKGYGHGLTSVPFNYSWSHMRLLTYHSVPDFVAWRYDPPFSWDKKDLLTPTECCVPLTRIFQTILDASINHTRLVLPYIEHFQQHHADINLGRERFDLASITPLLGSLATMDLNLSDAKGPLLDLLVLINNKLRARLAVEKNYLWIDGLEMLRVGQGLQKDYFGRQPGCFPVSMNHINTLLRSPTTHDFALEYMQEYY
ncbi:hypothetical protein PM082_012627 [Marasmius tenuissimus]|nr:hypothetical protein PM082_012627 [Marasmius tenuissimus]